MSLLQNQWVILISESNIQLANSHLRCKNSLNWILYTRKQSDIWESHEWQKKDIKNIKKEICKGIAACPNKHLTADE